VKPAIRLAVLLGDVGGFLGTVKNRIIAGGDAARRLIHDPKGRGAADKGPASGRARRYNYE